MENQGAITNESGIEFWQPNQSGFVYKSILWSTIIYFNFFFKLKMERIWHKVTLAKGGRPRNVSDLGRKSD